MEITEKRGSLFKQILLLFFGLLVVALSVGNFYFIIRGVYGKFSYTELKPDIKSLKTLFESQKQKVAILNSTYTRNLLPEGSSWLDDNISTWKKFTENFGYEYEVISDEFIETKQLTNFDLIILPGSKSLSDKEIIRIKKFLENGGNILATSGTASYSNDGKWRGWEFFSDVFGIKFSSEIKNEEISRVHTLRGGLALTANIPAGYSLKVATWDRPIAAEVLDPRSIQLSYWYDYKHELGLVREEIKKSAGIVYGDYGKGRFFWMGFEINSIIGLMDDHVYLERLLRNSLSWLSRDPITYVRDWPDGFNSAAVFMPYLGGDFSVVPQLLNILKRKQINPTFVLGSDNKEQLKVLSSYGEVIPAIAFGYPSAVNDTAKNLFDYQAQHESIRQVKLRFEEITSRQLEGVLTQFGLFDNSTLKALSESNYAYFVSDSLNGNSLPKTLFWGDKRIMGIFKNSRDDIEIVKNFGLVDSIFQFYTYQEDIDRVMFEGGLYLLKSRSEYQLQPQNIEVIGRIFDDLRNKNYWITTASEISNWFSKKSQVEVSAKKMGSTRVRITISNSGDEIIEKIDIDADLSEVVNNISLSAEIIGTKLPTFKKLNGGSLVRLSVDELKPHESRIYYIDYDADKNISMKFDR